MVTRKQSSTASLNNSVAAKRLIRLAGNVDNVGAAINVIAERLLADVQCPPTNLEAVFPQLNVTNCYGEDLWGSGELRREGKNLAIVYNSSHSITRRRFTIAHELGHALLESTGRNCPREGEGVERICDMIAAELLMPRSRFLSYVDAEVSVKKITKMAQIFQTSITTTAIRFSELLNVSVFMANDAQISWSFGAMKKPYILADVKEYVGRAMRGESGSEVVFFSERANRGEWQLQWMPLGHSRQALFLAKSIRRYGDMTSY